MRPVNSTFAAVCVNAALEGVALTVATQTVAHDLGRRAGELDNRITTLSGAFGRPFLCAGRYAAAAGLLARAMHCETLGFERRSL